MTDTEKITVIDLLRHGECEGGDIFRGSTNVELSAIGKESMQQMVNTQAPNISWQQLISSPLKRCRQFAESLGEQYSIPLSIEDDFRELHYGDWEGIDSQFLWKTQKQQFELLYTNPIEFNPPNAEPMLTFQQRVIRAWGQTLKQFRGKHLLLVQHGGTIRMLLAHLLSMPLTSMAKVHVPYACLIRFNIYHHDEKDNAVLMFHRSPRS